MSRGARGAALLAVLLALSFMSALVVGGLYVTRRLATASAIRERGAELEPYPEQAIARTVATWDSTARSAQAEGATAFLSANAHGRVQVTTVVTRVSAWSYWIVSQACDSAKPLICRRLGLLVRAAQSGVRPNPERGWAELP